MSGQHGQGDQGTKNTLRTLIILSNYLSQTHMECTFLGVFQIYNKIDSHLVHACF